MKMILLSLMFMLQNLMTPFGHSMDSDSSKAVKTLSKVYPQESKRDYKRFMKIYSDPVLFEKLVKGKDSSQILQLFGEGDPVNRDLFELMFNISDPDFSFALLYRNNFSHFKVKPDDWYLQQFAILFNTDGMAYKIFDNQTRGHNLFDKSKMKSL